MGTFPQGEEVIERESEEDSRTVVVTAAYLLAEIVDLQILM